MRKIFLYILLHITIFMYSLSSLCLKMAANVNFLSDKWIMLYSLVIVLLGIYAILWQQILKKIPLNIAYASKSVTLIWGILWGILIYGEVITWNNFLGCIIVFCGVILMITGGENNE